jgi:protein-L-isoaspartate(D-aspartate) O-methyltransferase
VRTLGRVTGNIREAEREALARAVEESTGVSDPRILDAFRRVPREAFVPADLDELAYEDRALPIGEGQTISQPSMIALMLAALAPKATDRALDVGTGSGYAAALLGQLTAHVHAIEILPVLAARARETLARVGVKNVEVEVGDGAAGQREHGPFDVILVSAAARTLPRRLLEVLALGGRIAIPVGDADGQHLMVGHRRADGELVWERRTPCVFVPLVSPFAGNPPDARQAEPTVRDVNAIGVTPAHS